MSRLRAVALAALVVVLAGCVRVADEPEDRPDPQARSVVGGVETWDLRGVPTSAAFGRVAGERAATYRTRDPRPVELLLPCGSSLGLDEVVLVDFASFGERGPASWSFGVTTGGGDLGTTTSVLREQLAALGLPTAVADDFAARARRAEGSQEVTSPFQKTRLGELGIGVRAVWQPRSDRGVVDVAGDWGAGRQSGRARRAEGDRHRCVA